MFRITKEDVAKMRAELKEKSLKLLNKAYLRSLEDINPWPLTWRIWLALIVGSVLFWWLVAVPLSTMYASKFIVKGDLAEMGWTFIYVGLITSSFCFLCAIKAMRKPRGKNWNKWFRKKDPKI